jgi:hypothetical protein
MAAAKYMLLLLLLLLLIMNMIMIRVNIIMSLSGDNLSGGPDLNLRPEDRLP